MTHADIFQWANFIALLAWIPLFIAPKWKWTSRLTLGIVIPGLCLVYLLYFYRSLGLMEMSDFSTLDNVMMLFTNPGAVVMGWVHYLAFDLLVGLWITRNASHLGINHWWTLPCLIFTLMLGPIGLLMYLVMRTLVKKQFFLDA